jgi:protein phosphatase PTC7
MAAARKYLEVMPSGSGDSEDRTDDRTALGALAAAHSATHEPGSSTACILRLDTRRSVLDGANLGDSGFLLLRGGAVAFASPAQEHFWDCPFQFASLDHSTDSDSVADADAFSLPLAPGDIVVLATDGLLDNCHRQDIVAAVLAGPDAVQASAEALATLAARNAADPDFESPYWQEAVRKGVDMPLWDKLLSAKFSGGKMELGRLKGGKMDDITVLVAYVEEALCGPGAEGGF